MMTDDEKDLLKSLKVELTHIQEMGAIISTQATLSMTKVEVLLGERIYVKDLPETTIPASVPLQEVRYLIYGQEPEAKEVELLFNFSSLQMKPEQIEEVVKDLEKRGVKDVRVDFKQGDEHLASKPL